MIRALIFVLPIIFLGFGLACQSTSSEMTPQQKAGVESTVNSRMEEITAAAEKGDVDNTFKYLSRDPAARFYINSKEYTREMLIDWFRQMFQPGTTQKIELVNRSVTILSPESACWQAVGEDAVTDPDGTVTRQRLTETWLWAKRNGNWEVIHYHETALPLE